MKCYFHVNACIEVASSAAETLSKGTRDVLTGTRVLESHPGPHLALQLLGETLLGVDQGVGLERLVLRQDVDRGRICRMNRLHVVARSPAVVQQGGLVREKIPPERMADCFHEGRTLRGKPTYVGVVFAHGLQWVGNNDGRRRGERRQVLRRAIRVIWRTEENGKETPGHDRRRMLLASHRHFLCFFFIIVCYFKVNISNCISQ